MNRILRNLGLFPLWLALLAVGCGGSTPRLSLTVTFPDADARARATLVKVMAILPGAEATCEALISGDATPGFVGYTVIDEIAIQPPASDSAEPLEVGEPAGRRLFFAFAEDADNQQYLRGCSDVTTTSNGPDSVQIALVYVGAPCTVDGDCDNGVWCDGDEHCIQSTCQDSARDCSDGDPCTQDVCNETTDACDHPLVTNPGTEGPVGDATCSDGLDNDCDGQTDAADTACLACQDDTECADGNECTSDTCTAGACSNAPVADGTGCDDGVYCTDPDTCTSGTCGGTARSCDDSDPCTDDACNEGLARCDNTPVTDPPGVEGPKGDPTCSDGLDNDCDGQFDDLDTACMDCQNNPDCDDNNDCTDDTCDGTHTCVNTAVTDGAGCDDGLYCTVSDSCTGGVCDGLPRDCSSADGNCLVGVCDEIGGACVPSQAGQGTACEDGLFCTVGDTCDAGGVCQGGAGSPCTTECVSGCDDGTDTCTPSDSGTACSADGFDCTGNESCDGGGNCVGVPNDAYCEALSAGSLCRPACAADTVGCVQPPTDLALVCEDPVSIASSTLSHCDLTLTGGAGDQSTCLACSAEAGIHLVAASDFDDGAGACDLDGWALVSAAGNNCTNTVDNCTIGSANRGCCASFNTICTTTAFGQPVLLTNKATNCGGGDEEWRLRRTFNLTGLTGAELRFSVADQAATTASGLFAYVSDATHNDQIYCLNAGPLGGVDGVFEPKLVGLPAWTDGNAAVTITFIAHSENNGEIVYLDDVSLRAWSGGCPADGLVVLDDDFAGCDLSAWTVTGSPLCQDLGCNNSTGDRPGVFAGSGALTLETALDTSDLFGQVEFCFTVGAGAGASPGDGIDLAMDTGSGYATIWAQDTPLDTNGTCRQLCLALTDVDPLAAGNPALGLRFDLTGLTVALYRVAVVGEVGCAPAAGVLTWSDPAAAGGGVYGFDVTDVSGQPLTSRLNCTWGGSDSSAASDGIRFQR